MTPGRAWELAFWFYNWYSTGMDVYWDCPGSGCKTRLVKTPFPLVITASPILTPYRRLSAVYPVNNWFKRRVQRLTLLSVDIIFTGFLPRFRYPILEISWVLRGPLPPISGLQHRPILRCRALRPWQRYQLRCQGLRVHRICHWGLEDPQGCQSHGKKPFQSSL